MIDLSPKKLNPNWIKISSVKLYSVHTSKKSPKDEKYGLSYDVIVNENISCEMSEFQTKMILTTVVCITY